MGCCQGNQISIVQSPNPVSHEKVDTDDNHNMFDPVPARKTSVGSDMRKSTVKTLISIQAQVSDGEEEDQLESITSNLKKLEGSPKSAPQITVRKFTVAKTEGPLE